METNYKQKKTFNLNKLLISLLLVDCGCSILLFLPTLSLSWLEFKLSYEDTKYPNALFIFPGRFNENVKRNLFSITAVLS